MSETSSEENPSPEDLSLWGLVKRYGQKLLPQTITSGLKLLSNEKRFNELVRQAQDILIFEYYQEPIYDYSLEEIKALGAIDAGELSDFILKPSKTNRIDFHQTYDWYKELGGLVVLVTMTQVHDMAVYQSQAIITSDEQIIT